ncbi:7554_t:CDS:2 [Paraglomus brasilianum]|uniref:7554_t:CDS:1 n=1 Tax=Paraglomus brasilianum TaxID=144538 RepID=A0A9N9G413_9GLOM|nr:7554_t:CDS:2 [Paraglomus brasilianum]
MRRIPWTRQEDDLLINLYHEYGPLWTKITQLMVNRTSRQCAERWNNTLRPGINTAPFTTSERNMIVQLYHNHGSQWSKIASHLPGRTPRMVKNSWYSMQRAEATRIRKKMSIRFLVNQRQSRHHPY